tara:strand:+ start:1517 stop:1744 length:228 start_codon:yes stop_codon:yes gene_type:complete
MLSSSKAIKRVIKTPPDLTTFLNGFMNNMQPTILSSTKHHLCTFKMSNLIKFTAVMVFQKQPYETNSYFQHPNQP